MEYETSGETIPEMDEGKERKGLGLGLGLSSGLA